MKNRPSERVRVHVRVRLLAAVRLLARLLAPVLAVAVSPMLAGCGAAGGVGAGLLGQGAQAIAPAAPTARGNASSNAPAAAAASPLGLGVIASAQAEAELLPDRTCTRPLEKFNILEKVVVYGGQNAQLRLQRLIESDFQYSNLTDADKKLLKYLAYTTVWVPVQMEVGIARVYSTVGGKAARLNATDAETKARTEARLQLLRGNLPDFPSDVRFTVETEINDGAYTQLGAWIQSSQNFLEVMNDNTAARDLVLAHELSHVYKRHRLKQMQAQLISSAAGFDIARKLMAQAMKGADTNPISQITFAAITLPKVIDFVKTANLSFSKEQELEADGCAARLLHTAKIDACAAWAGYAKIVPQDGLYHDTHPSSKDREANFSARVPGVPCTGLRDAAPLPVAAPAPVAPRRPGATPATPPARSASAAARPAARPAAGGASAASPR